MSTIAHTNWQWSPRYELNSRWPRFIGKSPPLFPVKRINFKLIIWYFPYVNMPIFWEMSTILHIYILHTYAFVSFRFYSYFSHYLKHRIRNETDFWKFQITGKQMNITHCLLSIRIFSNLFIYIYIVYLYLHRVFICISCIFYLLPFYFS